MNIKGWSLIFEGPRLQAELLQAILEANGVRAEVFGDSAYGIAIDLTAARLLVPEEEAGRARHLLKEAEDARELEEEDETAPEDEEAQPPPEEDV